MTLIKDYPELKIKLVRLSPNRIAVVGDSSKEYSDYIKHVFKGRWNPHLNDPSNQGAKLKGWVHHNKREQELITFLSDPDDPKYYTQLQEALSEVKAKKKPPPKKNPDDILIDSDDEKEPGKKTTVINEYSLTDYSGYSYALTGPTTDIKEKLEGIGAKWNRFKKCWFVSKKKEKELLSILGK